MSTSGKYRVTLHFSHPKLSADDIAATFPLKPRYARSIGAPRITTLGEVLGGVYLQTDVSFEVSVGLVDNDDVLVDEFVDQALRKLPLDAIDRIVGSGGTCFFLFGVYSEGNLLVDFSAALLSLLAEHGIGLKFDFWGGPEH